MKCLLASALILGAALSSASSCPLAAVKPTIYYQTQDYQGMATPYVWYFSPCSATNAPNLPIGCAGGPGFLQEYNVKSNDGACQMSLSTQVSAWTPYTDGDKKGYSARFANSANLRTASIKVQCNTKATSGVTPIGNAEATSPTPGVFHWDITLESSNACGDATQAPITSIPSTTVAPPPASGCPVSSVQPTSWDQDQVFLGQKTPYTWFLDPCQVSSLSGYPNCAEGNGFFQEYNTKSNGAACQMSLTAVVKPWASFTNSSTGGYGYKAVFTNPSGYRTVNIQINCDVNAPDSVVPIGDVQVQNTADGRFIFDVVLKSRQACALTPTVGPLTSAPPSASCPLDGIVPAAYTQNQLFQGITTPFTWFFSPCKQENSPNAATCTSGPGYLQEFDALSGQCQMSLDTIVVGWMKGTVNGSVSYNTNLVNRAGDRTAQIFVVCDENAGNLEPSGDAVATQTRTPGSYFWEITLKSSKICGENPTTSTSTLAPTTTSTPNPATDCSSYNEQGCTACTTSPSGRCGYCLETKTCDEGTSSGPLKGSCPSNRWQWYPTQCQ